MKKLLTVLVFGTGMIMHLSAYAQEDRNAVLMKKLFSKLEEVFSVTGNSPSPEQNFLVLANPGYFVQKDINLSTDKGKMQFSQMLNTVPRVNWIYKESSLTVPTVYNTILRNKELPIVELLPDQKKRLAAAQMLIWKSGKPELGETIQYKTYKAKKLAYVIAFDAIVVARAQAEATGRSISLKLLNDLNNTRSELDAVKGPVLQALETMAELGALDPKTWWQEKREQYDAFQGTYNGIKFPLMMTYPDYSSWMGDNGWQSYVLTEGDLEKQQTSSHVDYGGGVGASWGLWRVGAGGNYSEDKGYSKTDAKNFTLKFEVMRVSIPRDTWMDPLIFRNRAWKWPLTSGMSKNPISTGGDNPKGDMPLLVTGLLLARKVNISADWSVEELTTFASHLSASTSFGWGPFSIKGHYNKDQASSFSIGKNAGTSFSNEDVQIIGYFCDVLPQCPFPDPALTWSTPLQLRDYPFFNMAIVKADNKRLSSFIKPVVTTTKPTNVKYNTTR
jgi:hypothetical protein